MRVFQFKRLLNRYEAIREPAFQSVVRPIMRFVPIPSSGSGLLLLGKGPETRSLLTQLGIEPSGALKTPPHTNAHTHRHTACPSRSPGDLPPFCSWEQSWSLCLPGDLPLEGMGPGFQFCALAINRSPEVPLDEVFDQPLALLRELRPRARMLSWGGYSGLHTETSRQKRGQAFSSHPPK